MRLVIITTGGTGGHVFPALAVAEELQRRHEGLRVVFVGGRYGREREYAEKAGLEFVGLPVRGVMGRGLRSLGAGVAMLSAMMRAWWMLFRMKPDAVIGFGGYAGFAPVAMAALRGIPCALHEQNSRPGAANRLLARWVDKVFLSFPDDGGFFDARKCTLTGNPVRATIREAAGSAADCAATGPCRRLLVAGGSLGARPINEAVTENLASLRSRGFEIWHQTGPAQYEDVREKYAAAGWTGDTARVEPFIDDMAAAYAWADVVLCRAGATTVAELAVCGAPSVLVPFPHATHNHQLANARHMEKAGAAVIIMQNILHEVDLGESLEKMFSAPDKLRRMAEAARSVALPHAARTLAEEIEAMAARAA